MKKMNAKKMNGMKKFIAFLCTLTCILSLTACGAQVNAAEAEYQQQKLEAAENAAPNIIMYLLNSFMDDENYEYYSVLTNEEVEYDLGSNAGISVDGYGFKGAMESFHMSGAVTGKILEVTDVKAEAKKSQIIINADVKCEKKNANVELILSNDMFFTIEGAALNPISTTGELMSKAAMNTLLGMGTVFLVLILISGIIASFALIPKIQAAFAKKEKEEINTTGIDNAVAQIAQQEEILEEEADDTELVAVIAAAIAAYEGSTNTEGFVVRSIRRRF